MNLHKMNETKKLCANMQTTLKINFQIREIFSHAQSYDDRGKNETLTSSCV